jgi:hypothetical protein
VAISFSEIDFDGVLHEDLACFDLEILGAAERMRGDRQRLLPSASVAVRRSATRGYDFHGSRPYGVDWVSA